MFMMIDEQLFNQVLLGGGSLLTAYLTHKAATSKIRSSESIAFSQERTKLLDRYEGQIQTMKNIIETIQEQNNELKQDIYKLEREKKSA
ncbi:hypothetical protein [Listeria fleischmannii]|nr:hypothetical protein [Listeria fleischmannii]